MGRRKESEIPSYLYETDAWSKFGIITSDLLLSKPFQDLSSAARQFYIVLAVNKATEQQRTCLYNTLKDYYKRMGEDKADIDIAYEAGTTKKSYKKSKCFCFPQVQADDYGYSAARRSQLLRELENAGFIKVKCNKKSREQARLRYPTVYEFIDVWKQNQV